MTNEYKRTVGDRGYLTIPMDVRGGIQGGEELVAVETEKGVFINAPVDEDRLAEGYWARAERSRRLEAELDAASTEVTEQLGDVPGWDAN